MQAPRGEIVDRNGRVLVDNRARPRGRRSRPTSCPRTPPERRELYGGSASCCTCGRGAIARRGRRAAEGAAVRRPRPSRPTSPRRTSRYLLEHQDDFPGVDRRAGLPAPVPAQASSARTCSATSARSAAEQLKQRALPRRRSWATASARRASSSSTTASCAARTAPAACRWTRSATSSGQLTSARAEAGPPAAPVGRPRRAAGGPGGARGRHRQGRVRGRWTSTTARCSALGSQPSFDPNVFAKVDQARRDYKRLTRRGQRRAAVQPRDPGRLSRPARRSSSITAVAALEAALITPDTSVNDGGSLKVGGVDVQERRRRRARRRRPAPGADRSRATSTSTSSARP